MRPPISETQPLGGADVVLEDRLRTRLAEGRRRTLSLVEEVCESDLDRVHSPLMSPLVWDLGHIAAFEDLWLCAHEGRQEPLRPDLGEVYDATETPRSGRGELSYLRRDQAIEYMDAVRERALEVLERVDPDPFIWEMVVQHEAQHSETMLQTLKLAEAGVCTPRRRPRRSGRARTGALEIEAGKFELGAADGSFAYDNERPRHELELPAFRIDRAPVTNRDYLAFVEDGGYERRELWSAEGWAMRRAEGWERPLYWTEDRGERSFERTEPLDSEAPVMHVSWYEADAYARWRGARLPSEAEWERAAALDEEQGELDQLGFGPGPAGPFLGDCWEWTAGGFDSYPGFEPYPYREYSEVFFGGPYKVLRGASWATRPLVARTSFRNWDHPERRQIFAGFRCAEDA